MHVLRVWKSISRVTSSAYRLCRHLRWSTSLVATFSWYILPFPFIARGPSHFFLEVELTHIYFLSKYQLALFLLTRSIFLLRTCWNVKQPVFWHALACLTESHTVVFGIHSGGARHRGILPQFRVSFLLLLRRKGVYHTCFLKPDMYRIFFCV